MFADAGIPMLVVQWPLMIGALVPIIVVESLLIRIWLPISFRDAITGTALANVVSTVVGVPLAWLAMFVIELVTMLPVAIAAQRWNWDLHAPLVQIIGFAFSAAWIGTANAIWLVPLAAAVLLVPCFFISVWLERRICLQAWPGMDSAAVRRAVFRANLASYFILILLACWWSIFEFMTSTSS
jgi:hypothetical protein